MKQFTSTLSSNWSALFNNIAPQSFMSARETFARTGSRFRKPNFKFSKTLLVIILGVIVIGGIIFLGTNTYNSNTQSSTLKPAAPTAKETYIINREFAFPVKDDSGKEISKIKYFVESANLQDEILVKGQRARSVQGRIFLIVNIKITNSYKQGIQINSRDYVRLVVNGNVNELIAADIHNDPVEVQAISTKSTRIGFPIDDTKNTLELQIGEINGKKQTIKIDFSKK